MRVCTLTPLFQLLLIKSAFMGHVGMSYGLGAMQAFSQGCFLIFPHLQLQIFSGQQLNHYLPES